MNLARVGLLLAVGAVGALLAPGCSPSQGAAPATPHLYEDVRATSGVDFVNRHEKEALTIRDTLGHGAGLCDFDGDGNLDLVLLGPDRVRLYRGDGHFHFTDVTAQAGLSQPGYWEGIAIGDFNGDGKPDLYLCGYNASALYENLGGMRFKNVTEAAGLAVAPPNAQGIPEWRASAAFLDVDNDGKLDLYVTRYVQFGPHTPQLCHKHDVPIGCDPQSYALQRGSLFYNLGNGRFRDETASRGMASASGYALGVACGDYDDDGYTDVAVANDEHPGDLFHNLGNGRFEQKGVESGIGFDSYGHVHAGMGLDWGDFDRDGHQDLYVTTYENEEKNLYRNIGGGLFQDVAFRVGASRPAQPWISWGTKFLDYDNDGFSDLIVASGHVQDLAKRVNPKTDYPQPLVLLHNQQGQSFADVSGSAGPAFQTPLVGRAVVTGDIDNDGGVDIVVTNGEGQPLLLRNVMPDRKNWLSVALENSGPNRQAIGARVTVVTAGGRQVRDVTTGGSYLAANDVRLHFGLGVETQVQYVDVRWPGAKSERFSVPGIDRVVTLRRGAGGPATGAAH